MAKRNFIYNLVYQIFTLIVPLVSSPYISRILGPVGVGTYTYYYSIATYFTYFELLGINNYGVRSIAKCLDKESREQTFSDVYAVQFLVSIVVISVYILFSLIIAKNKVIAFSLIFFVLSAGLDINWYFFGTEQFRITTTRNCLVKTIVIIMIFAFVKNANDVIKYTVIMSTGYLVSQLIMWVYLLKEVKVRMPSRNNMLIHFRGLLLLFVPVLAVSLYHIMDKITLGIMSNVEQVAYYENAEKIAGVPSVVTVALGTSMLPRMTSLTHNKDDNNFMDVFNYSMLFVQVLSVAMMFGIISISDLFIPWYYGDLFINSSPVLKALSLTLLFSTWASVIRTQYLIPKEKDKEYICSVFAGAISNMIINVFLIPRYGAVGAAIATVVAEAVVALYQSFSVKDELPIKRLLSRTLFFIPAGIIMFVIIRTFNYYVNLTSILKLIMDLFIGVIIYLFIAGPILFFVLKKEKKVKS